MVISKKLLTTALILLSTNLVLCPVVLSQTEEENTSTENAEQLEIIDNNSVEIECILSSKYDALTEEQKVNQELPLCYEIEVTTEELAAETNAQDDKTEQSMNEIGCINPLDFDALTDDERAATEAPLCDESDPEEPANPLQS